MSRNSWVLIDTETTGLTAPVFVVDLAAQKMSGWEPVGPVFRKMINHGVDIPAEAARVNGCTREVLERDGYAGGIYCYPSLDAPALDAGGEKLAQTIDELLRALPEYSDERDELSVALYGDVQVLTIDGDGRIIVCDTENHRIQVLQ